MASPDIPVGIDLGTTFSAIAYLNQDGRPCTITNSEGELTTPSVVFFDRDEVIVGTEAMLAGETDVRRLARTAKRDMGGVRFRHTVLDRHLPPEVIQSFVLKRLKNDAALKLGQFTKAVITVPAYFNEPRRKATQDAGELAGLDVIDIINEPTAAALAYGVQRGFLNERGEAKQRELILVYDLGGGTFDATLMEIDHSQFTALATAGDVYLGGIDWDQRLFDFAKSEIEKSTKTDLDADLNFKEKLMNQCIRAKKSLTARTETVIRVDNEGERYSVVITRQQFEELTSDLLERTRLTTNRLLQDAKLRWSDLTKLLLVGGSTRMPMVIEMLERQSGLPIDRSLSPDEAVAHGAAIYAGMLLKHGASVKSGISVININSHDLGVLGVDPQSGKPRRKIVIPRNHPLPTKSAKRFQTSKDGQKKIVVQIVEGGTDEGQGTTTIGKCLVTDLPQDIKKGTEVVVSFSYLSSGRLEVLAQLPSLNVSANSTIDRASGMTTEQIIQWKQKLAQGASFLESEPLAQSKRNQSKTALEIAPANPISKSKPAVKSKTKPKSALVEDEPRQRDPVLQKAALEKNQALKSADQSADLVASVAKKTDSVISDRKRESAPNDPTTNDPALDFEVNEHSGIFAFGDEEPKPEVGASVLGILRDNLGSAKSDVGESMLDFLKDSNPDQQIPGDSVLDFLNEATEKKPRANDSALDDFLKERKN